VGERDRGKQKATLKLSRSRKLHGLLIPVNRGNFRAMRDGDTEIGGKARRLNVQLPNAKVKNGRLSTVHEKMACGNCGRLARQEDPVGDGNTQK